jgi:hypothetical protein
MCFFSDSTIRLRHRAALLLIGSVFLAFLSRANGSVDSVDLRRWAVAAPLLWSESGEGTVEAAVQQLGAIELFLATRGGAAASADLPTEEKFPVLPSAFENSTVAAVLERKDGPLVSISEETNETSQHPHLRRVVHPEQEEELTFSLFQPGDGSEQDPDGIPTRYLQMQLNHRDKAKAAVEATLKWRDENDINTLLSRPHPKFEICKAVFPHFFVGRDTEGHVVFLQRPALIDLQMAKKNGLSFKDLLSKCWCPPVRATIQTPLLTKMFLSSLQLTMFT